MIIYRINGCNCCMLYQENWNILKQNLDVSQKFSLLKSPFNKKQPSGKSRKVKFKIVIQYYCLQQEKHTSTTNLL